MQQWDRSERPRPLRRYVPKISFLNTILSLSCASGETTPVEDITGKCRQNPTCFSLQFTTLDVIFPTAGPAILCAHIFHMTEPNTIPTVDVIQ